MVFIAVFIPPIPVAVKRGLSMDLAINICLCILGFFPGLVHSLYIISMYPYKTGFAALGGDGHDHSPTHYGSVTV